MEVRTHQTCRLEICALHVVLGRSDQRDAYSILAGGPRASDKVAYTVVQRKWLGLPLHEVLA